MMSGLIKKDICILYKRKKVLLLFIVIALVYEIMMNSTFIMTYLPFLGMIMAHSTIAYDEANYGMAYLVCLPFSRSTYVKEKYSFIFVTCFCSWLIALICCFAGSFVNGGISEFLSDLPLSFLTVLIVMLVACVMIPIEIRYGAESSRLVLGVFSFGIVLIAVLFSKVLPQSVVNRLETLTYNFDKKMVMLVSITVFLLILVLSYRLSKKWLEQKEF